MGVYSQYREYAYRQTVPDSDVLWLSTSALEKCTHLYDETQGTVKHKCFQQSLSGVRRSKIINFLSIFFTSFFFYYFLSLFLHPVKTLCQKRLCLIVPCVLSYRWVHFSRAILFNWGKLKTLPDVLGSQNFGMFYCFAGLSTEIAHSACCVELWLQFHRGACMPEAMRRVWEC